MSLLLKTPVRRKTQAASQPAFGDLPERAAERYHALDALRAMAMLLGIVLHAAICYMPCRMPHLLWAIHDEATSAWLDGLFWGLHAFRMPLFFLIAGFFSALLYERRGPAEYLVQRSRRVFVPLIGASVVLLPLVLMIWCLGWLVSGECTLGQVLRLKFRAELQTGIYGLGHLWFLEHLFLLCVGFWAWHRYVPLRGAATWTDRLMRSPWKVLLLSVPSAAIAFLDPAAVLDFDQPFVPQPGRLLYYGTFFVGGTWLHGQRERLPEITSAYKLYLLLCVPIFISLAWLLPLAITTALPGAGRVALACDHALLAWLMSFGLIGLFVRRWNRPSPVARYLSDASYYVYLVHLPLVALFQIALFGLDWPPTAKFIVTVILTAIGCLGSYQHVARGTWLGERLTGRRQLVSGACRRIARWYVALPLGAAALVIAGVWQMRQLCFDHNLHPVISGEVYRSAMTKAQGTEDLLERLHLKSLATLQGGDDEMPWFVEQKRICLARHVALYPIDLPEDTLPTRDQLLALIAVADSAPRPILFQGRCGFGRAALAAAIVQLLEGQKPAEAQLQYRWQSGNIDHTPGSTHNVLHAYALWLDALQTPHSPATFRRWASHEYRPTLILLAARRG